MRVRFSLFPFFLLACSKPLSGSECEAFKHQIRVISYRDTNRSDALAKEEGAILSNPGYVRSTSCPQVSRAYFDCAMGSATSAELAKCKH